MTFLLLLLSRPHTSRNVKSINTWTTLPPNLVCHVSLMSSSTQLPFLPSLLTSHRDADSCACLSWKPRSVFFREKQVKLLIYTNVLNVNTRFNGERKKKKHRERGRQLTSVSKWAAPRKTEKCVRRTETGGQWGQSWAAVCQPAPDDT